MSGAARKNALPASTNRSVDAPRKAASSGLRDLHLREPEDAFAKPLEVAYVGRIDRVPAECCRSQNDRIDRGGLGDEPECDARHHRHVLLERFDMHRTKKSRALLLAAAGAPPLG